MKIEDMENFVVKSALYYDAESDTIIMPHYTGCFEMVDCTRYITLKELRNNYDKEYIAEVKDNYVKYRGKKYYYAEYSPETVGDWKLLSDLSELENYDENREF